MISQHFLTVQAFAFCSQRNFSLPFSPFLFYAQVSDEAENMQSRTQSSADQFYRKSSRRQNTTETASRPIPKDSEYQVGKPLPLAIHLFPSSNTSVSPSHRRSPGNHDNPLPPTVSRLLASLATFLQTPSPLRVERKSFLSFKRTQVFTAY